MRIAYSKPGARALCRALAVPVYQAQDDIIQAPHPQDRKNTREMMTKEGEAKASPSTYHQEVNK